MIQFGLNFGKFGCLLVLGWLLSIGVGNAQRTVTQAERNRMEADILRKIRYYEQAVESDRNELQKEERNHQSLTTRYQPDSSVVRSSADYVRSIQRRLLDNETRLAEWREKLRNLPPVRDEQAEREKELRRQQEETQRLMRQQEEIERQRQTMQRMFETRRQNSNSKVDRQIETVQGLGGILQGALNTWAENDRRKREAEYAATEAEIEKTRFEIEMAKLDRQLQEVRQAQSLVNQSGPAGDSGSSSLAFSAPTETTQVSDTPTSLFDFPMSDFFAGSAKDAAADLTRSLSLNTIRAMAKPDEGINPLEATSKEKLGELRDAAGDLLISLLPEERQNETRLAYSLATGDLESAIDLLPPERRFEMRAARMPLAILQRDSDAYFSLWDREAMPMLEQISPGSVATSKDDSNLKSALDLASDLLVDRPASTPPAENRLPQPNRENRPRPRPTKAAWEEFSSVRDYWNRNASTVWRQTFPQAKSEQEARDLMKRVLAARERELKARDAEPPQAP